MIEYFGPGPKKREDAVVAPASGFERLVARARRALSSKTRLEALCASLAEAVKDMDPERVRALALKGAPAGASPKRGDLASHPMGWAAYNAGSFGGSAIELFLSLGADPDEPVKMGGRSAPLASHALRSQQWEGALALLSKSANPLASDSNGEGLWLAAAGCLGSRRSNEIKNSAFEAVIERLKALGANPNERSASRGPWDDDIPGAGGAGGSTPLALAADWPMMTAALLKAGADPNIANHSGMTPLMWAAAHGSRLCAGLLAAAGAEADARDHQGVTALMRAAAAGCEMTVELLLAAGADSKAIDHNGRDALDWLIRGSLEEPEDTENWQVRGAAEVGELLIKAGVPRLGKSRLEGLGPEAQEPGAWLARVRAEEERLELAAGVESARPAPRSPRL